MGRQNERQNEMCLRIEWVLVGLMMFRSKSTCMTTLIFQDLEIGSDQKFMKGKKKSIKKSPYFMQTMKM